MPLESRNVSEAQKVKERSLGSLGVCLVEGDPEQRRRERRVRRRSLVISIVTETAVLGLLILLPLFSKSQPITVPITTPIPPYSRYNGTSHDTGAQHIHRQQQNVCHFCPPTNIPPTIVTRDPRRSDQDAVNDAPLVGGGPSIPGGLGGGLIPIPGTRSSVPPPPPADHHVVRPSILRMTHLDPAMLIYRVEPAYPPLARQIHKEGRVELRAIIATDGSIQSLEVVGGDPLFFPSALEAVRQWRYKPTILNGQPVQIDTHITVIYTMSH
ncbi:MAG: hypothetical protein DMG40_18870 [Acidobacteria bacterium]|nr:MAG: hypothetical protein DMG40_18870 [Acidobacteriota bacterium]